MKRILVLSMYDDIPHEVRQEVEDFLVTNEATGDHTYFPYLGIDCFDGNLYPCLFEYCKNVVGANEKGQLNETVYVTEG